MNAKNHRRTMQPEAAETLTADGEHYDPDRTYYFFDVATQEIGQSTGLRRADEFLCTFGLKVVRIEKLRTQRDDALADGQTFFNSEIERLRDRIRKYEAEKPPTARKIRESKLI
jgi:hypothetical protein